VLRYVHTARTLGEDLERQRTRIAPESWKGPLAGLYRFAWDLRLKGKSVADVPLESLAEYAEEHDEQVRDLLDGEGGVEEVER